MKTIFLTLAMLVSPLIFASALADDINFSPEHWTWYFHDYPRWHYQYDGGHDGTGQCGVGVYYIQLELKYSENTLVEPNIINMYFYVSYLDGDQWTFREFYFDIPPGVTEQVVQFPIGDIFWYDSYLLNETNTIPEGGGWVVIDFENSWLDLFTNAGVTQESLGKLKAGYK